MNVFTLDEAKIKRGSAADEMLTCSKCGESQGVHIYTPPSIDGCSNERVHIELWKCLNCHWRWWEEYKIRSSENGVARDLFNRIMNRNDIPNVGD